MPPTALFSTTPPKILMPGDVLARQPGAVGGEGDVVLEHERFHLPRGGELGQLVIVQRAAEDVRRGVGVEVDEATDGADGRRRRRIALHAPGGGGRARGGAGGAPGGGGPAAPAISVR